MHSVLMDDGPTQITITSNILGALLMHDNSVVSTKINPIVHVVIENKIDNSYESRPCPD